jgi:tRNA modification GTPase
MTHHAGRSGAGCGTTFRVKTRNLATARVTLLTPPGRGALAVVGLAGPDACDLAGACFQPRGPRSLAGREDAAICFGRWTSEAGSAGEDLVVVKHTADRIEVHCHGGHAAAEAIIANLERLGAMRQSWPEWLADTGVDPIEIEAYEAMGHVAGPRAARILIRQAAGLLRSEIERLVSLPRAERLEAIDRLLAASRVGLRLADPWRVVLAGPVNAGKSSLANAIAGYARSIVSPEPGTTRDVVTTRLVLGGFDVELLDTAGLRAPEDAMSNTERAGMARAEGAARSADLVLRVMSADAPSPVDCQPVLNDLVVVTKADLGLAAFTAPVGSIVTSEVTVLGITDLVEAIVARLVPELASDPALLDGPVPFTERQVALIRGAAME